MSLRALQSARYNDLPALPATAGLPDRHQGTALTLFSTLTIDQSTAEQGLRILEQCLYVRRAYTAEPQHLRFQFRQRGSR